MPLLTRRELTLLLFALTIFLTAYNLGSSVRPSAQSAVSSLDARALLHLQNVLREDGRRVETLTDDLERDILGDWETDQRPVYDLGPHGTTEGHQHKSWRSGNVPVTELLAHAPGFTILDNVLLSNGTLYLVSDHASHVFPRPEAMLSTGLDSPYPPVLQDLKFITRYQAIELLGYSAHRISGVSLLCLDHPSLVDNQTLVALHRAYSSIVDSSLLLSPPTRTIFANTKRAVLDQTGYELKLALVAFPYMTHFFADDWDDLERAGRPMFFDRVLIADRAAAELGAQAFDFAADVIAPRVSGGKDVAMGKNSKNRNKDSKVGMTIEATDKRLSFSPAFALPASVDWAVPLRAGALSLGQPGSAQRRAVTYVSTQARRGDARLRDDDHVALVRELEKLGEAQKWDVHVVELGGATPTSWADHMYAAAQSSVMLGVHGDALTNSVLLRPGPPAPAVVEFFPDGKFTNEHEFVARALGIEYVAWRNTKKYPRGSLPPISPPSSADSRVLSIDVPAVVQFVKEQMKRS